MEVSKQVPCISIYFFFKSSKLFESFLHIILPDECPNKFPTPEQVNHLKAMSAEIIQSFAYNDRRQKSSFPF